MIPATVSDALATYLCSLSMDSIESDKPLVSDGDRYVTTFSPNPKIYKSIYL